MKKILFAALCLSVAGCSSNSQNQQRENSWYLSSSDSAGYQYMTTDVHSKGVVGFKCLSSTPMFAFYLSEIIGDETSPVTIAFSDSENSVQINGSLYADSLRSGWAKTSSVSFTRESEFFDIMSKESPHLSVHISGEKQAASLKIDGTGFLDGFEIFKALCDEDFS